MRTHLLAADVRLDNRDELIRLMGGGREFHSVADSLVLLRAWQQWGEGALDRIVGDFAFAIYDSTERRLTLVRDGLGNRPLFYAEGRSMIAFASMPSGLLAIPEFRTGFDMRSLAFAIADVSGQGPSTYFRAIRKVLPGQIISFSTDGVVCRQYWQPPTDELELASQGEYIEAYRDVLDRAVRPRLRRSSGPIATHLSSGLDSSAVTATAKRLCDPNDAIIAFTAAPRQDFPELGRRGRFADESHIAALTANNLQIDHDVVRTSGSSLSLIRDLVATSQEPYCNILNQRWFWSIDKSAMQRGARILLTGEYGNSTLHAGGMRVLPEWVRALKLRSWWHEVRYLSRRADVRWQGILFNSLDPWLPHPVRQALYRRHLGFGHRAGSAFLTRASLEMLGDEIERAFLTDHSGNFAKSRIRALRRSDNGSLLKGALARFGIDSRAPLGDRRVVEFSLRLPAEQLLARGVYQPLARQALRDRLPSEVLDAEARGYQSADWLENVDPEEVRSMTDEIAQSATASELVDVTKIRDALSHWPSRDVNELGTYQRLAIDLPMALATGMFIIEAERWMSGHAPEFARFDRPADHGPTGE